MKMSNEIDKCKFASFYCEPCGLEWITSRDYSSVHYCPDCNSDNIYASELTDYLPQMSDEEFKKLTVRD